MQKLWCPDKITLSHCFCAESTERGRKLFDSLERLAAKRRKKDWYVFVISDCFDGESHCH